MSLTSLPSSFAHQKKHASIIFYLTHPRATESLNFRLIGFLLQHTRLRSESQRKEDLKSKQSSFFHVEMGHKEKYTGGHVMLKMSLSLSLSSAVSKVSGEEAPNKQEHNRNTHTHTRIYIYIIYIHIYIYISMHPFLKKQNRSICTDERIATPFSADISITILESSWIDLWEYLLMNNRPWYQQVGQVGSSELLPLSCQH